MAILPQCWQLGIHLGGLFHSPELQVLGAQSWNSSNSSLEKAMRNLGKKVGVQTEYIKLSGDWKKNRPTRKKSWNERKSKRGHRIKSSGEKAGGGGFYLQAGPHSPQNAPP